MVIGSLRSINVVGKFLLGVLVVFLFATVTAADAGLVREEFYGEVTFATADNPLDVTLGSTLSGYAVYNDNLVNAVGGSEISPQTDPDFGLSVTLGSRTFTEQSDYDYDLNPTITFSDGLLTDINFLVIFSDPRCLLSGSCSAFYKNEFEVFDGHFYDSDSDLITTLIRGQLSFPNTITPIPIPAALPLFASGIVGLGLLAGGRRRGNKAA